MFFYNIKQLVGILPPDVRRLCGEEMARVETLEEAYLYIENGVIVDFGKMENAPEVGNENIQKVDASGKLLMPAWCDSHTHLVYADSREAEFVDRINGLSYEAIAARGGGILNSAQRLNATDEDALFEQAKQRLDEVRQLGTGAIEIKSGYGLCTEGELKMLRVIRRLKETSDVGIKATFLGAHAFPLEFRANHRGYLDLIQNEMLPRIAAEGLAEYMDVFCEKGFFSVKETDELLKTGLRFGLKPKIHANQLHISGGVQVGVANGAVSVDHLESMSEAEIEALQHSATIGTLLPSAAFFLNMPYQPARAMLDAGLPLALASDFNPGSTPSGNIPLLMAIACTQLRMTPAEAFNAVTINGAYAMELSDTLGSITKGKKAHLILTKPIPSLDYIPYYFGVNCIEQVFI
jgi:imidazolonepropionase